MTPILDSRVHLVNGVGKFLYDAAALHLDDRGILTITRVDAISGTPGQIAMAAPVTELVVKGERTILTFREGPRRCSVDFSPSGRAAAVIVGYAASSPIVRGSGVREWVSALRAGGARVRYRTSLWRSLWSLAGILFLAAIVVGFAVLAQANTYH